MPKFLLLFILFFNNYLFAQHLPEKDIDFLLHKIRNVYAGYQDKVNEKEFNQVISEVRKSNSRDTFGQLVKLTSYFKDHHLSLFNKKILSTVDSNECSSNLLSLDKYLKNKSTILDGHEGYWMDELSGNIIFLKKISPTAYKGYIIETRKKVPPGFCTIQLQKEKGGIYNADIVSLTWGGFRVFTNAYFKSSKVLVTNSFSKWERLDKYKPGMLNNEQEFSFLPELKILDSNNILIRMPDFSGYNVKVYDSIITANESFISKAKNLIIDIRNNGGGTSRCYNSLHPFICTGPIIRGGGHQLCSEDIIEDARKDMEPYIKLKDTATVKEFEDYIAKMERNKNNFIYYDPDTLLCPATKPNHIKNVAIIINHGCRSAAELMLLSFKQSKKVTIFGEPTAGAVDYLDMLTFTLPETGYTLWVGTVRRRLTEIDGKYDNIGIKPNIEISDNEKDWVDFVRKYYENK